MAFSYASIASTAIPQAVARIPRKFSDTFYWDNIFFKVEDRLFCVPRCEFERSSEVFAGMFLLPSGTVAPSEGQDKEHPIVLDGYKKDDFASLLRVMYPTAESLIFGTKLDLGLEKEEWVSVLKLSTAWNMQKIRKYAVHILSTDMPLSPIEKILLGRAYKVATWLHEGVTNLVTGDPGSTTLEKLATLGWETAARILWIRDNARLSDPNRRIALTREMFGEMFVEETKAGQQSSWITNGPATTYQLQAPKPFQFHSGFS